MWFRAIRFALLRQTTELTRAFTKLNDAGIFCLHGAGYTIDDGLEDIADHLERLPPGRKSKVYGYCFYHEQDMERAISEGGLSLAFGPIKPGEDARVATDICAVLQTCGLRVEGNGEVDTRIHLPDLR
jgi:hypothetical protein